MGTRHARHESPLDIHAARLEVEHAEAHKARLATLITLDCFKGVPQAELERLADIGIFRAFAPGTMIMSERKLGDFLYLVLRGTVRVTLHDRDGREVLLGLLDRGDCCGEDPLFGDYFRRATAYAERPCNLLQLPLNDVRELLPHAPHLTKALRDIYRQRLSYTTLSRVPLFNHLLQIDRTKVAALLRPTHYERSAAIITQGTPGHTLHVIESGQVVVERDGQPLAYLNEGDFFGEMSLLEDKLHNATVRALTPATILDLPAEDLKRLLEHTPDLAERLREVVAVRKAASATVNHDHTKHLSTAVQHGLLRGTHLFVRTPALCPEGCHLCETGCHTRHGMTRLHLNGTPLDELDILDTCRQCRVGTECIEACPEDALTWDAQGAVIVNDRCTGCGACVEACPYDAVQMRAQGSGRSGPLWSLLNAMRVHQPIIRLEPTHVTQRADKCDMCHGYDDMACLSACPTGSLRLVPVEELFPF